MIKYIINGESMFDLMSALLQEMASSAIWARTLEVLLASEK